MKYMRSIIKAIDFLNNTVGHIMAFFALPIVGVIVFEVISRRFFNSPTIWAYEVIVMCFGIYIIMLTSFGLLKGSLVSVDLLSSKFAPVTAHVVNLIAYTLLFMPFVLFILPACYKFAFNAWVMKELSWSQWAPPVYPIKTFIPIGWTLLFLQGVSEMLKSVVALREIWGSGSRTRPDSPDTNLGVQGV
jgi:TRAP-type mannitol/chloroaromatic compound transport system permease small subunit